MTYSRRGPPSCKGSLTRLVLSLGLSLFGWAGVPSSGFAQPVAHPQQAAPLAANEQKVQDSEPVDVKLAAGESLDPKGGTTVLDPYMIVTNASSARRVIHRGLSLIEPEQGGLLGFLARAGYVGLDYYLEYLSSVTAHELGHYGELRRVGARNARLDLSRIWYFGFGGALYSDAATPVSLRSTDGGMQLLQQNPGFVGTSQEKMAIAGRGDAMEVLIATEILKEAVKKGGKLRPLEAVSYVWSHNSVVNLTRLLTSGNYGSIDIAHAGADADVVAYNQYSLFHSLFPYPLEDPRWRHYPRPEGIDKTLANAPPTIQRPSWAGGDVALHNYFLMRDYGEGRRERRDPHQIGVMVFNVVDPYTLASFYAAGRYLALGDRNQQLPPRWVPQFNGYFGVPGPQYEAAWHLPTRRGLVSTALRLGVSPELASAIGVGIDDVRIPRTRLFCSVSGELIYQRDGTPVDESTVGGTLTTEVTVPLGNVLRLGIYHLYQSPGVWSPSRFGLRENHTVGVTGSVLF